MFGFRKTSELERLRAVYADQTDNELLRLHDEREGLTDAARQALAEVMERRGLRGGDPPAVSHAQAFGSTEDPLEAGGSSSAEEAALYTFRDVIELRETIRVLEGAGIPLRVVNEATEEQNSAGSRSDLLATIMVEKTREQEARALLTKQLPFLAHAEAVEQNIELTPAADLTLLVMCERREALGLVSALSDAGISFYWRDGREDKEVPGEEVVAFEVHAAQLERAEKAVQACLASQPSEDADKSTTPG